MVKGMQKKGGGGVEEDAEEEREEEAEELVAEERGAIYGAVGLERRWLLSVCEL